MNEEPDLDALRAELERQRAELQKAQVLLDLVGLTRRIGLWQTDLAGNHPFWSSVMYELYYLDPAESPPSLEEFASFVHPDDHEMMAAAMQQMFQQPAGSTPPVVFRTNPDRGPVRHLETSASLVVGPSGAWASGAVVDVTEREGARQEALKYGRRLGQILERMPFVVFGLDRDSRITFSNMPQVTSDVIGSDYRLWTAPGSLAELDAAIGRAWETGEMQLVRTQDVRGRWWEARYVGVTSASGELEELLAITVDITEQRDLEQKVQQAQKVESLGVLAGGIAHDFNNLLVGIIGNADLALMDITPGSPARESLSEIMTASHRASELCRQMLAYSGRGQFVVQVVDLREVVQEIAHLLKSAISKTATVRFDFAEDTLPIEVDVNQIRQVVMNLITNASDALEGGEGVISVTCGTILADQDYLRQSYLRSDQDPGLYTFIEVSDTGRGMDEATRTRMFEPFFSSKGAGRGLGLAAVLGIARGHRGSIRVHSELGRGTTVRVLFPASEDVSVRPSGLDQTRRPAVATGTVLVVDDEPSVRRLARRTLERAGFSVITAADGAEGVERFRSHRHEIVGVLLDMTMPVMGGEEAFRQMQSIDPGVRVVLSSGYSEQEATRQLAREGLAGFVQKPYRTGTLRDVFVALADRT